MIKMLLVGVVAIPMYSFDEIHLTMYLRSSHIILCKEYLKIFLRVSVLERQMGFSGSRTFAKAQKEKNLALQSGLKIIRMLDSQF